MVGQGTNWHLYVHAGFVKFRHNGVSTGLRTAEGNSSAVFTLNAWHHIAADKDASGILRVYCDGVMYDKETGLTDAMAASTAPLRVGHMNGGFGTSYWDGNIEEVRVTKGLARYASDSGYTVPTAPFPRS